MDRDSSQIDRLERKVRILEEMFEQSSREAFIDSQRRSLINTLLGLSLHAKDLDLLLNDFLQTLLSCNFLQIERWGAIFLYDEEESILTLQCHHNFSKEQLNSCSQLSAGQCLCGQTVLSGEVIFTTSDDPRHDIHCSNMLPHGHYCIPIRAGVRVLGLICLHVPDTLERRQDDENMLLTAAGILAGALQRFSYETKLKSYQIHLEKRVEGKIEELRLAENRYQSMFENSLNGIFQTTLQGTFLACNPALAEMHGFSSPRELVDSITDIGRQLYADAADRRVLVERLEEGPVTDFETRMYRRDGSTFWVLMSARKMFSPEMGEYIEGTLLDITRSKEAEQKLAEQKERLAVTLRSIGDGVITTDTRGRVVLLNQVAEQLTGWPQELVAGRPLAKVFNLIDEKDRHPCADPVQQVMTGGGRFNLNSRTILVARDGTERSISHSGAPILDVNRETVGVVLVFRDMSEQNRLEAELIKSKKLESLGVLAGGIAHDFNNILTAILGNLSLVGLCLPKEERETHELVEEAKKAALSARDLVQQLRTFAKGGEPVRKTAAIDEIIRESADFILRGSNVACRYHFPDDLWFADIDAGQISRVIQNLVLNAKQAMTAGGFIDIGCRNIRKENHDPLPLADGLYIEVSVRDQGKGMDTATMATIFDPYFTTKDEGYGLGLSICHSIIRKHKGHIAVESEPGRGTVFIFYVCASKHVPVDEDKGGCLSTDSGGRALVLDDEALVGISIKKMLEHLHYQVTLVRDGQEAINSFLEAAESGMPFSLAILDLTIPGGMGGEEVIKELLRHDPRAKVLVSSGYSDNPVMAHYQDYGFSGVLEKPFQIEELGRVLATVMNGADNDSECTR